MNHNKDELGDVLKVKVTPKGYGDILNKENE